jgi:hypothetical protein
MKISVSVISFMMFCVLGGAQAQLIANNDNYPVREGEPLLVEAFGVLENDTFDGNNAGEEGATATVLINVSQGTLNFFPDGSFDYTPNGTFNGVDSFTYQAVKGVETAEATVTLTACTGGPRIFTCWKEAAYLSMLPASALFTEGFENDLVWGSARSPNTEPSVTSNGIIWTTNWPDPPASNEITTGGGPVRTGSWAVFDPERGYATGTPGECDFDNPPPHCLFHDGVSGERVAGQGYFQGVGGYFTGSWGANVGVALDGNTPITLGKIGPPHHFYGAIDKGFGFREFSFVELDGKAGQELLLSADDFTFASAPPIPAMSRGYLLLLGLLVVVVFPLSVLKIHP